MTHSYRILGFHLKKGDYYFEAHLYPQFHDGCQDTMAIRAYQRGAYFGGPYQGPVSFLGFHYGGYRTMNLEEASDYFNEITKEDYPILSSNELQCFRETGFAAIELAKASQKYEVETFAHIRE